MATASKGQILPIGVDLGSQTLKVAQLHVAEGNTQLLASGCAEIPVDADVTSPARLAAIGKALRRIVKSGPFKGKACVMSIPAEATFVQHVKIPKVTGDAVLDAIEAEVAGKLPYPVSDAVIRYVIAGEAFGDGDARQEVIVVCAKRCVVEAYARTVKKAGLDVRVVNVEPCAIVECFGRLFRRASDSNRTILFVDMGAMTTQVVFSQGARVVFARNLSVGGELLERAAAEKLEITPAEVKAMRVDLLGGRAAQITPDQLYAAMGESIEAFADELLQCLRYYESVFRNQAIERAIFVGGQAYDRRLCQMIARKLNLPAQIGDPLVRVHRAEGSNLTSTDPLPNWAVAVGLSLGGERAA